MLASMNTFDLLLVTLSLFFSALMAGFFFAWSCSTMPGLDRTDAKTAITAMNAINRFIRASPFILPFLLTPLLLMVNGFRQLKATGTSSGLFFFLAAFCYLFGVTFVTIMVSEPLNYKLAETSLTASTEKEQHIWASYSAKWQAWNHLRTLASSLAFILCSIGSVIALT